MENAVEAPAATRRWRRRWRVFGCGGGGGRAAAKTSELGHDDESPTTKLETTRREATSTFRSRWNLRGDPPSRYGGLQ